jgi:hypothetical protein
VPVTLGEMPKAACTPAFSQALIHRCAGSRPLFVGSFNRLGTILAGDATAFFDRSDAAASSHTRFDHDRARRGAGQQSSCRPAPDAADEDRSARLEINDRLVQGRLALAVEVRVRLVEHDKERVAIQGASERDALPLPPDKSYRLRQFSRHGRMEAGESVVRPGSNGDH